MLREYDPAWAHGESVEGVRHKIKSKHCGKILNGGITRLKEHLPHKEGQVIACPHVPRDVMKKMQALLKSGKQKKATKDAGKRQEEDAIRDEL